MFSNNVANTSFFNMFNIQILTLNLIETLKTSTYIYNKRHQRYNISFSNFTFVQTSIFSKNRHSNKLLFYAEFDVAINILYNSEITIVVVHIA